MASASEGRLRWLMIGAVASALGLLVAACSPSNPPPTAGSESATRVPESPQYSGFVAATEFIIGESRFPFALLSVDGDPLENARVQVSFYSLREQPPEFRFQAVAKFHTVSGVTPHRHDDGTVHEHLEVRGVYVVDLARFDHPGNWGAQFAVTTATGDNPQVQGAAFAVLAQPKAPGIGERVPASRNPTLADVVSIEEIESRVPADDMHELSVAQALEIGKPFVVVFATPIFCTSRMCGPVTDVVAELHTRFRDQVNFIHIEPWELELARTEGRLAPTEVMLEWELPSEPWVFVVDSKGRVAARYEGLVSSEELGEAISTLAAGAGPS